MAILSLLLQFGWCSRWYFVHIKTHKPLPEEVDLLLQEEKEPPANNSDPVEPDGTGHTDNPSAGYYTSSPSQRDAGAACDPTSSTQSTFSAPTAPDSPGGDGGRSEPMSVEDLLEPGTQDP